MHQQRALIFMFIFINTVAAQINLNKNLYEGDICNVDSSTKGVCKNINQCPIVQQQLSTMKIRPSLCGFEGFTPIVCCPKTNSNILNGTKNKTVIGELAKENCKKYSMIPPQPFFSGRDAHFGEFSSMAAIGWPLANGTGHAWYCGGSLISENYVLTAAHCTFTSSSELSSDNPTMVKLGSVNLKNYGLDVAIVQIIKHPEYNARNKYNDIALVKLAERVDSTFNHRPACIMLTNDFNNRKLNALGWGQTEFAKSSDILQVGELNIYNNTSCNVSYQNRKRVLPNGIIDSQICAGADGKQDTCPGDSGGPLLFSFGAKDLRTPLLSSYGHFYREPISNHFIVGVTSFGIGCGGVKAPGVYSRVSSYVEWIESTVWA